MSASRSLTAGERRLANTVFGSSLNYSRIRIHDHRYVFFQPANSAMTPNGQIYMSRGAYAPDYSQLTQGSKGFLVHELAHVWQYQLRVLNPVWAAIGETFAHRFNYRNAYAYTLRADRDLLEYDIEQQAAILEDYYYVFVCGAAPGSGHLQNPGTQAQNRQRLQAVLQRFMDNPAYPALRGPSVRPTSRTRLISRLQGWPL